MEIRSASWLEFFVFSGRSLIAAIIYIREVTCNHFSSKLRVKAVSHTWSKHKQKILSAPAKMISHTKLSYYIHYKLCLPQDFKKWFGSAEKYQFGSSPFLKLQSTDD